MNAFLKRHSQIIGLVAVLLAAIGIWIQITAERRASLMLAGGNADGFLIEPNSLLRWEDNPVSSIYRIEFWFKNIGNKFLDTADYIEPLSITFNNGVGILNVSGHSSATGKQIPWTYVAASKSWTMQSEYLNPGDYIAISVLTAITDSTLNNKSELANRIKFSGRFRDLEFPDISKNFFEVKNTSAFIFDFGGYFLTYLGRSAVIFIMLFLCAFVVLNATFVLLDHAILRKLSRISLCVLILPASFLFADLVTEIFSPLPVYQEIHSFKIIGTTLGCVIFGGALYFLRNRVQSK